MKTILTIGNANQGCDVLVLEIGQDYCCYALLKGEERSFHLIKYISFDETEEEEALSHFFEEIQKENCERAIVCSAFPQALLVPLQFSKSGHSFMDALYDASSQKQLTDTIAEWQLTAAYSIPVAVYNRIVEKFPSAQFLHAYTPALKVYDGFSSSDQIDLHFSIQSFRVLLRKDKQVQLAQIYSYKTPLDVAYYLLKICYEFQLNQSDVFLIVSGLIDEDSAMYNELHNYFLNLHFAQGPSYSLPANEYPQHYFTSLYNLAACVS